MQSQPEKRALVGQIEKRVHVAFPVRVVYCDKGAKACPEVACTYDIHPRGARISRLRNVREIGDIISVERGRSKTKCRITWIGDPDSELRGQFGIECIEEDKTMWEAELAELDEIYQSILPGQGSKQKRSFTRTRIENRRQGPRFPVQGTAELAQLPQSSWREARVNDLSGTGCLIQTDRVLMPGTDLMLVLSLSQCDVTVKGQVRHAVRGAGLGIEFYQIRKGDRPLLDYVLRGLAATMDGTSALRVESAASN